MAPPLVIPGYSFDPATNRYFKQPKSAAKLAPSQVRPPAPTREESDGRKRKRARKTVEKGKWTIVEQPIWRLRELSTGGNWEGSVGKREKLLHDLRATSFSRSTTVRTIFPDCLPLDDEITHLSFDERSPSVLRLGCSNGSIASGNLARSADENAYFPNDEEAFRTSWFLPSKVTSLQTCGNRVLATCLGQPAQALVGTTSNSISLASVTLAPHKTSLWTSVLSPDLVALGCDKKVLVSSDPSRPGGQMDGYSTGGNRGDGTVFALDIYEDLIFAGTRNGKVRLFDRRSTRPTTSTSSASSPYIAKDELNIVLDSPVTHLRVLKEQPYLLVAAGLSGSLGVFDLRFPPRPSSNPAKPSNNLPVVKLGGHVNSFSHGLGFDVWKDEFVVAAGQDSRLRLWSLRNGQLVAPQSSPANNSASTAISTPSFSPAVLSAFSSLQTYTPSAFHSSASYGIAGFAPDPPPNPFLRTFSAPLKSVVFSPLDPLRLGEKEYSARLEREEKGADERERERWLMRWDLPSVWVAEGGQIEGFAAV